LTLSGYELLEAFDINLFPSRIYKLSKARLALKRRRSSIIIPYNERELLEIEKLKLQTIKLRKQIEKLNRDLVPIWNP